MNETNLEVSENDVTFAKAKLELERERLELERERLTLERNELEKRLSAMEKFRGIGYGTAFLLICCALFGGALAGVFLAQHRATPPSALAELVEASPAVTNSSQHIFLMIK